MGIGFTSEERFENKVTASTFAAVKAQLCSLGCINKSVEISLNSKTSCLCLKVASQYFVAAKTFKGIQSC